MGTNDFKNLNDVGLTDDWHIIEGALDNLVETVVVEKEYALDAQNPWADARSFIWTTFDGSRPSDAAREFMDTADGQAYLDSLASRAVASINRA